MLLHAPQDTGNFVELATSSSPSVAPFGGRKWAPKGRRSAHVGRTTIVALCPTGHRRTSRISHSPSPRVPYLGPNTGAGAGGAWGPQENSDCCSIPDMRHNFSHFRPPSSRVPFLGFKAAPDREEGGQRRKAAVVGSYPAGNYCMFHSPLPRVPLLHVLSLALVSSVRPGGQQSRRRLEDWPFVQMWRAGKDPLVAFRNIHANMSSSITTILILILLPKASGQN